MERDGVYLRCADERDAGALAALRTASALEMGLLEAAGAPLFEARARREFGRLLRAERMTAWVLVGDERVVGCACVMLFERLPYPGTSLHAEIGGVYVAPGFRRHGFARELVAEAVASASAFGVRRTYIAPTEAMRDFYVSLGFTSCGWLANETAPRKAGAPLRERTSR